MPVVRISSSRKTRAETSYPFLTNLNRKKTPSSEPIISVGIKPNLATPMSLTEPSQVVTLSKQEILDILSRKMPTDKASIIETFMTNSDITNERVPSIYSSYFFRKDIIREFQRNLINLVSTDKLTGFPLSNYNLYNKDDILNNTTYRPDILGSRNIQKTSGYLQESIDNMKQFMNYLSKKICSNIGGSYAKDAVEKAISLINDKQEFDILIAATRVIEDVTLPMEARLDGVIAFIIVELGECNKYPAAYSINLICTDTKKSIPGTGTILMGGFLYTILSHPNNTTPSNPIIFPTGNSYLNVTSKQLPDGSVIENCTFGTDEQLIPVQQVAVLELADAYFNSGGLCMYEKFGFSYDQTMFTNNSINIDCFDDRNNLPMKIDFETKPGYSELDNNGKKQKVLEITAGIDRGFLKSKICSIRGDDQRLLGYLKSIKLNIDNTPGKTMNSFLSQSAEGNFLNQLNIIHEDPTVSRGTKRTAPPPLRPGTLDEFIDYLENPLQPDDPIMRAKIKRLIQYLPKQKKRGGTRRIKKHFIKRRTIKQK